MVQLATNVRTMLMFMSIHAQQDILVHVLLDMDIHLKHLDVVHVARRHLEFAINAILSMFIAIIVQRGSCHLCLVLTDTHIQLRRYVLVVLHRDFAINATYLHLLPVLRGHRVLEDQLCLLVLDLPAEVGIRLHRRAVLLVVQVHHLHQVLVLHPIVQVHQAVALLAQEHLTPIHILAQQDILKTNQLVMLDIH